MNPTTQQQTKGNETTFYHPRVPTSISSATSPSIKKLSVTQKTIPPVLEKGVGRVKLSTLTDTKHVLPSNSSRLVLPEISDSSTTVTTNTVATDRARRANVLVETVAAQLMKAALDRQSNIFPVFLNHPETNEPRVLPGDEKLTRPEKKLLMSPALGIAAGANAMGGHSKIFAMSRKEAVRCLERERASNRMIFSWWEARNVCRRDEDEIATVEEELRRPLWSFFRKTLTEQETQCLAELREVQEKGSVGRTAHGAGKDMGGKGLSASSPNFVSSDRGISMPLTFYERLFNRVLLRVHQQFLTMLQCQATGTGEGIEMPLESRSQGTKYVQFLLQSHLAMSEAGKNASGDGDFVNMYPPLVSIPEERCFQPLLAAETAFSVTLLWRILDQTKAMVPGMAWALQLFTRYVLPHVYENFTSYKEHLPKAGAIGEQVEHLHVLPLNIVRQRSMFSSTIQAKDDLQYMEGLMKAWAWRTWRGSVMHERRRNNAFSIMQKTFERFHRIRRLQKCFSEWRVVAKEGQFSAQLNAINGMYGKFLSRAQNAACNIQLFPEMENGAVNHDVYRVNKNRFVAFKLAETAQHTKGGKKSLGTTAPEAIEGKDNSPAKNSESPTSEKRTKTKKNLLDVEPHESLPTQHTQKQLQSTGESAKKEMKATIKLESEDIFVTSVLCAEDEETEVVSPRKRAMLIFADVFGKLQDMETISGYLREEIAVQNRLIEKLERENKSLKSKVSDLEETLLSSEEKRLRYCNILQERELDVQELERRIAQLKSRIRCQQHRPWQRTFMRVLGELCGASTSTSEYADELRISHNKVTNPAEVRSDCPSPKVGMMPSTTTFPDSTTSMITPNTESAVERDRCLSVVPDANMMPGQEEERLFGELAPLVISSTRNMPNAQIILRDWANNCLEDMESLDDLRGGALSSRFHLFSEEVRSGVLLSRLLFYLALPRYQNKTAVAQSTVEGFRRKISANLDFTEHRRRLLMQHNVQLESPFPTYSECFGDLLNLKPSGRMSLLLQFATELVEGPEQLGDEYVQRHLANARAAALKAIDMTPLPAVDRVELQEVVDPYALARGDSCATLTFIALLYVRFAHPFNHKAKQSALIERESMLHLLSNGNYSRHEQGNNAGTSKDADSTDKQLTEEQDMSIARKFLAQLEEEEQSPWQLFLKYCQPLVNTMAHPFILRGNFWPCAAFDSPSLAQLLGSLGLALHRSLEKHRWHIIVSCLVPVNTYSGLSRGIFTGRRASFVALQVGLERDCDWAFAMEMPCIQAVLNEREAAIYDAFRQGNLSNVGDSLDENWHKKGHIAAMDKSRLMTAFSSCSADLLQLFLQRSSLSNSCAMPVLDLGSWRLLWIDLGLVFPEDTEKSQLDLEQLTRIFSDVLSTHMEFRKDSKGMDSYNDTWGSQQLPSLINELYFPEFLVAVVLLAHEMFPPLSVQDEVKKEGVVWLGDALLQLVFQHVTPKFIISTLEAPVKFVRDLRANIKTRQVLLRHNKALLLVFNTYCKDVCGVPGMEREQLLHMLRDAILTSTEISQTLIYELFQPFSVTKKADEAIREDKRREVDARPRDISVQRRRGNVSIVDPNPNPLSTPGKNKEYTVLLYDGFIEFLCVLCHFKQPNPLIPFDERLELFLRRGLLRPLSQRNDALSSVLAPEKK